MLRRSVVRRRADHVGQSVIGIVEVVDGFLD